jgi:hypothetical protein
MDLGRNILPIPDIRVISLYTYTKELWEELMT